MARLIYPDPGSQLVYQRVGTNLRAANGQTATVYMDATGTTLANIAAYDPNAPGTPGAVISGSTLTVDTYSRLPSFWGPTTGEDTLWVTVNNGPLVPVNSYYDPRIDAIIAAGPVPGTRQVIAGAGLTGGGALSADVTLDVDFGTVAGTVAAGDAPAAAVVAATLAGILLPAATGTDDTTAINTILAANAGKRIVGRPGSSYLISAPLVVYSGTTLDMTGCTITLIAGSGCNMLQNRAVATVRRALDAVTTATSTTLTSATAAFVVGDVGKAITIQGAGAAGVPLTTTIAGYTNATTVTLTAAAGASVTGQYVAIGSRDSNITLIGGYWDRGANNSLPVSNTYDAHSLRLRHIDGLTVRDLECAATGGKYAINPGDCTRIRITDVTFTAYSSDGIHLNGPCREVIITNIIGGTMGDDIVSMTAMDTFAIITDCAGDITDVVVENVVYLVAVLTSSALKVVAGQNTTQTSNYQIANLVARNLTGPTTTQAVVYLGDTVPVGGSGGTFQDITIENVRSLGGSAGTCVLLHRGTMDRIRVQGIRPAAGDLYGVAVDTTVGKLDLSDIEWDPTGVASVSGVQVTSTADIDRLTMSGLRVKFAGTGPVLVRLSASGSTVNHLAITNADVEATAGGETISSAAGAVLDSVQMANLHTIGVAYPLGSYRGTTILEAANCRATGMTAWLYARTATAAVTVAGAVNLSGDADGIAADSPGYAVIASRASILTREPDALASGESTIPRIISTSDTQLATGTLVLTYFTAQKTETINNVRTVIRGTATGTPTLCRIGIYSVSSGGDLTLVASTANDTTLWNGTFAAHTRALSAGWAKVAGVRYAVGELFVGTTGPRLSGLSPLIGSEDGQSPRINGSLAGQSDLPSSVSAGSVANAVGASVYAAVLP